MEHNPRDPNLKKAYESFIKQTITQYKHELKAFFSKYFKYQSPKIKLESTPFTIKLLILWSVHISQYI